MFNSSVELALWAATGALGLLLGVFGLAGARRRMATSARQDSRVSGRHDSGTGRR